MHFQPFAETRFVTDQSSQSGPQRIRQRVGKGGEQHPGIGIGTGQKDGPVQGDDGLARACRSGDPRGSALVPFDPLALRRMEENRPFLPGIIQGACQFLDIIHDPEATLCIGVLKRIGSGGYGLRGWRLPAGS